MGLLMLDTKTLAAITDQIHRLFPETSSSQPKVRPQPVPKSAASSETLHYLLTFRGNAALAGGKTISRSVRVVVNGRGKILKVTTSH